MLYSGPDTGGAQLELKSVGKARGTMPEIPEAKSSEMTLRVSTLHPKPFTLNPTP